MSDNDNELRLSIDPGVRTLGLALWTGRDLADALSLEATGRSDLNGPPAWAIVARRVRRFLTSIEIDSVVYESWRIRPGRRGFQSEVFGLPGVMGAIATLGETPNDPENWRGILPRKWTGQRPKPVNHRRIWKRLNALERGQIADLVEGDLGDLIEHGELAGTDAEHAFDAVGIGLYAVARL